MGTLLFDFVDILTFGSLEKAPRKKSNHTEIHEEAVKPKPAPKNETKSHVEHKACDQKLSSVTVIKESPKKKEKNRARGYEKNPDEIAAHAAEENWREYITK